MYFSFMAIFELGSLICGTAINSPMLIVGRVLAGVGAAGVSTGAFSIIASSLPLHKRPVYIGILHSTFGVATILGPVLGGALTEHASWRWCFYINLPVGAFTFAFLILFFHPPPRVSNDTSLSLVQKLAKLDLIGAGLFIPSAVMILLALQWGGIQYAWKSATTIGLFLGGGGLTLVFVFWQIYKKDDAMIPPRLIKQRTIFIACFVNFFAMGAVTTSVYYLPEWFQAVKVVSPTKSGVMYLPLSIADILSATLAGLSVKYIGYANPSILIGTALMSTGTGLLSTFKINTGHQYWIPYEVLQGLGAGATLSMPYVATQTVLTGDDIPVGTSLVQLFQFLGGSVFLAIAQSLFSNTLVNSLSKLGNVGIGNDEIARILHAGSGSISKVVTEAQLPGVIISFNDGIVSTFNVATAAATASCVIALGLQWKSVKVQH
jgi:hypothetical protein